MNDVAERAERLGSLVSEQGLDLLLVSDQINVRYLTGYTGTNGLCVLGGDRRLFVTDFRYFEQVRNSTPGWDVREGKRDLFKSLVEPIGGEELRLGFDDVHLTVKQHARLRDLMPGNVELVAAGGLVERLRESKDALELRSIAAAAELADEIYLWIAGQFGLAGRTEREVALAIQTRALENGSEGVSFPPIVAAGDNGAIAHAAPRDVEIPRGTLVVIDIGCVVDGYCSDCTRTFATGEIDAEAREIYELVLSAQLAALGRARSGVTCAEVDAAARELIDSAGHAERFRHGSGHGVGLEVHEGPRIAPKVEQRLANGNVVTIEPGVYLPGRFGVRIEDLVVVGDGSEVLTKVDKQLTAV